MKSYDACCLQSPNHCIQLSNSKQLHINPLNKSLISSCISFKPTLPSIPPQDESSSSRPCKYFKKMNSSSPTGSSPTESGGFALTFGISIGVLSAIAIAIFASYFCTRKPSAAGRSHLDGSLSMDDQDSVVIEIGLDEATLNTYPQLLYSEAKEKLESGDGLAGASCCSICLADYKDSDLLRLLPDCDHLFHAQCIDPWLKLHTSCPICRNSPVRTPSNVTETASREPRRVFFDTWFVQFMH